MKKRDPDKADHVPARPDVVEQWRRTLIEISEVPDSDDDVAEHDLTPTPTPTPLPDSGFPAPTADPVIPIEEPENSAPRRLA